jgi:DNA-binding response OmpR family regulator
VEQLDGELAALASPEQRVLLLAKRAAGGEILRDHLLRQGFNVEPLWVDEVSEWPVQRPITPPGAVVLDLNVASERGWEMLKILRENAPTRDVPVLFYFLAQEQDSGSVFELDYLTKPVDSIELARALERQGLLGEGKQGAENLILIVDDEPAILEMHTRIIQDQLPGSRILQARNGRQALEIVREALPDIVLLDLMMPEMDGFRVLEAMQQDVVSRHIPVIVLTGKVLSEEDMAHLNQGVTSVLSKGLFSVQEVLAHVEAALSRSQRLGSETRRLVRKAMAYLHEHYTEPVSLKDAADYVGVSKEYLARCFRRETGMTLVNYLNRYRVQQAKRLLEAGQASVTDVALQVGFSSAAYFSRVFSREVGVSPTAYRAAHTR